MASDRVSNHLHVLEDTLWKERNLLEYLLFKLVVANLILAADAADFISLAVQEVDQVPVNQVIRIIEAQAQLVPGMPASLPGGPDGKR